MMTAMPLEQVLIAVVCNHEKHEQASAHRAFGPWSLNEGSPPQKRDANAACYDADGEA